MRTRWAIAAVLVLFTVVLTARAQFSGGDGSAQSPYIISSASDLQAIAGAYLGGPGSVYYKQTNDIDLTGINWTPIAAGTVAYIHYDGNGHTISNLTITAPSDGNVGLFGGLIGSVRDLKISGGRVEGNQRVGAIVGSLDSGLIEGCESDVTVIGAYFVGGLVGELGSSTIRFSSHRSGSVDASGFTAGGIAGRAGSDSTILNCFAASPVTGSGAGGLIGEVIDLGTQVTGSYWDTQVGPSASSGGGSGKTTVQMMQESTFSGWDFDSTWRVYDGACYPFLEALASLAANPVLSPGTGSYSGSNVTVTATCATASATIAYALGRNVPDETTTNTVPSGGTILVPLDSQIFLNVIAWAPYFNPSALVTEEYSPALPADIPVPSPFPDPDGHIGPTLSVALTTSTSNALIRYTTNGNDPDQSSSSISSGGMISVPIPSTLKARAYRVDLSPSAMLDVYYGQKQTVATPGFSPNGGSFTGATASVTITCATPGVDIRYTTDGSEPDTYDLGVANGGSVSVPIPSTLKAKAWKAGYIDSDVQSADFAEVGSVVTPSFSQNGGAIASGNVKVTISTPTPGAIIYYTIDGSAPTQSSPSLMSGTTMTVPVPGTLKARAWATGLTPSGTNTAMYTTAGVVQKPTFSPDSSTTAQLPLSVTLSCGTPGAQIRYTLDGTTPTAASLSVASGGAVSVSTISILKAKAFADGLFASPMASAYYGDFAGGSGTAQDPYLVATGFHLDNVRNHLSSHFKMIADVDLGVAPWNVGEGWEPIGDGYTGTFHLNGLMGTFDGGGYVVKNMTINRSSMNEVGLFGFVDAGGIIKNLGISSGTVFGKNNVGALVGFSFGSIVESYSDADVQGELYVGDLIGQFNNGGSSIRDCFASGNVSYIGDGQWIGGLVGYLKAGSMVNSYSIGSVAGSSQVGGLAGGGDGTSSSSYWDRNTSGLDVSPGGGAGKTTTQMQQQATYSGWDFNSAWSIDNGNDYPRLQIFQKSSIAMPPDSWLVRFYGSTEAAPTSSVKNISLMNEYIAGTDPTDPTSYFAVTNAVRSSGVFTNLALQVNSTTGRIYHIFSNDVLSGQGWQPVGAVPQQNGTGGSISFDIPVSAGEMYYRIGVELDE